MKNIIPKKKELNPYYIVTTEYTHQSAGVKVLHLLCHHLNKQGYPAFIYDYFAHKKRKSYINTNYITPVISKEIIKYHKSTNKNPIAIYPEVMRGNPINSNCVVRYLLNYPGLLGGVIEDEFDKDDIIFSYSQKIKNSLKNNNSEVLFMPVCDTNIFYEDKNSKIKRIGSCFYASKYQNHHNGELFEVTNNSIEITRGLPDSQTPKQIADLFRKSEIFYSYEDTSLATEALLCGCPVMFIKNKFFKQNALASCELGNEGCVYNFNKEDIVNATKNIPIAQKKYFKAVDNYWSMLDNFIKITQEKSFSRSAGNNIKFAKKRIPFGRLIKSYLGSVQK